MPMYDYVWLCRVMYSCIVGLCMLMHAYVGLCKVMYAYIGLCMAM